MIDWDRLKFQIVDAVVTAVNGTLYIGLDRAEHDVPVRKVFSGGRQQVRFRTATEINADRELRARVGLAPEILATQTRIRAVQLTGKRLNPIKGSLRREEIKGFTNLDTGGPIGRDTEYGFARTVTRRNRANDFMPYGEDSRLLKKGDDRRLADPHAERFLTARGRYELAKGRAISARREARVDLSTGRINFIETSRPRLGGGLRSTLRIVKATHETYPVIKGDLVAGDKEHDYAIHQELGNRHNPAHPFLRPRLPEWRVELPRQLGRSFRRLGR